MKTKIILAAFLMATFTQTYAQDETTDFSKINLGLGMGIDYGGFGGRITFLPTERVGVFAALGYNLVGAGFNAGALFRFSPTKKVCPTLNAMYGYNGVIKVQNASQHDGIYYGISVGGGVEFRFGSATENYLNVELLVPFRSQEFQDKIDELENDPNIDFQTKPIPVAFSVGYHFAF